MRTEKKIGILLLAGAIAVLIPYTVLTIVFEYPQILRQGTPAILTKFHEGGSTLVWTWFAFAITGIPLIPAYILIGQKLENKSSWARVATVLGVTGLFVQIIGLLRWTFVIPVLADLFINTRDESTRSAAAVAFQTVHQYGGVLLGEHLGQLLTIVWTIIISSSLGRLKLVPKWLVTLGFTSSAIYFLAQAELFATVMPGFPVWGLAGLIGSTLWLIWLILVGIRFLKIRID